MSDTMRRIYNIVDQIFDTRAISQESRYSRDAGLAELPKTARQALNRVLPSVSKLDRWARLKLMVSQQGLSLDGTSSHWEFFFDLTRRRAQLVLEWVLSQDQATDGYGNARIEFVVKPFPPVDSPIRQAVSEGKLLHRQMISMWKQECERRPDLPNRFRDSSIVLADFLQQGLDTSQGEFTLSTGQSPRGEISWIAQTRDTTYFSPFAEFRAD
jgi:hypothetical protein